MVILVITEYDANLPLIRIDTPLGERVFDPEQPVILFLYYSGCLVMQGDQWVVTLDSLEEMKKQFPKGTKLIESELKDQMVTDIVKKTKPERHQFYLMLLHKNKG